MVSNNQINFEKAIELSFGKFSYHNLIDFIKNGTLTEKQFAILNIDELKSKDDAQILCSNLVGQDGKIREVTAFKLNEFFKNIVFAGYLTSESNFDIMLKGIMDINGNVCRNILEIENEDFNKYLAENIILKIEEILEDIAKLNESDKQYIISKKIFQLYWALECIFKIGKYLKFNSIKNILIKCATFDDYTIREKTAKILSKYKKTETKEIKNLLSLNSNYYVNKYLKA